MNEAPFGKTDAEVEIRGNEELPDSGFDGNVSATGNTGGVEIRDNDISGSLSCRGNNPPAQSSGNSASNFDGECQT